MNSKYRNGFRYVLRCLPCVVYSDEKHGPYGVNRATTYVSTVRTSIFDKRTAMLNTISPPISKEKVMYGRGEIIPLNGMNNTDEHTQKCRNKGNNKDYYRDTYSTYTERIPLQDESPDD